MILHEVTGKTISRDAYNEEFVVFTINEHTVQFTHTPCRWKWVLRTIVTTDADSADATALPSNIQTNTITGGKFGDCESLWISILRLAKHLPEGTMDVSTILPKLQRAQRVSRLRTHMETIHPTLEFQGDTGGVVCFRPTRYGVGLTFEQLQAIADVAGTKDINLSYTGGWGGSEVTPGDPATFGVFVKVAE